MRTDPVLRREIARFYLRMWAVRVLLVAVTLLCWHLSGWWGIAAVVVGISLAMFSAWREAVHAAAGLDAVP